MAKTKGPLLSMEAHGTLAKMLNYSQRKSGSQCRKFNYPVKDPTGQQIERRILNEYAVAMWAGMSVNDKATWEASAKTSGLALTGYHYFLREALRDPATHMSMLLFFPFTYNVGTATYNIPNRDYDGTFQNAGADPLPSRAAHDYSKRRYCYRFQDTAARLWVPSAKKVPFNGASKYTWIWFFKTTNLTTINRINTHFSATTGYFFQLLTDGKIRLLRRLNFEAAFTATTILTANKWYHVVFTYDGSGAGVPVLTAYINGVTQSITNTLTAKIETNDTADFYVGTTSGNENFLGCMSGFVYLNRIIGAAEAQKLYNFATAQLQKLKPER